MIFHLLHSSWFSNLGTHMFGSGDIIKSKAWCGHINISLWNGLHRNETLFEILTNNDTVYMTIPTPNESRFRATALMNWRERLAYLEYVIYLITIAWHAYRIIHDDVIKWKHFPRHWPFVRGIHRWPMNSPHKGQWRGVNDREAGEFRLHRPLWRHSNDLTVHKGRKPFHQMTTSVAAFQCKLWPQDISWNFFQRLSDALWALNWYS